MKPAPFEYYAPDSLDAALDLKAEHGDEAKVLAGGQSLIPAMNFRVAQPAILVDLNKLDELRYVRREANTLLVGAMTLQAQAEHDALVAEHNPLLHETIPNIAHPQIRNRGTVGGSLAHADPASELPVVATALGARFRAKSRDGERWIGAKDFFAGMFSVSMNADEILVEIEFPDLPARSGAAFVEVARRRGDYAMAGLAAILTLDDAGLCKEAKLVYLNVGDGPLSAIKGAESLVGAKPGEKSFAEAARIASQEEMMPFGNMHASPDYQKHLSEVLTRRALGIALERAKQAKQFSREA
ncbi:MAG: xanthine dehydrogenase family protein subunit M [Chloroflexi bacterium]|nr:xanthine dehydrogenase family protein subunit M [Chloroflexota bacterium]